MGYKFIVLVAVVAIATIQVDGEDTQYDLPAEIKLNNAFDEKLEKLREVVAVATTFSNATIEFCENLLLETATAEVITAIKKLENETDNILEKLHEIYELAKNYNKNISECLQENEDKLLELPSQVTEEMVQCISDHLDHGISSAKDAYADQIYQVALEIDIVEKDFMKCGTGPRSVSCKAKLFDKLQEYFTTLLNEIENIVSETADNILELLPGVETCTTEKLFKLLNEGKAIFYIIENCAYEIIFGE